MAKKPTYTPMPQVPGMLEERYRVTLAVLSGTITVSEAAKRLGLSRVQYQTIMHRGLHGLIDGLSPKLPGRPAKSEQEQKLLAENERLRRENEKLRDQAEAIERMLGVASELVKHRLTAGARQTRTKKTPTPKEGGDEEDPREHVRQLRRLRMRATLVAALAGVSTATARRWASDRQVGPTAAVVASPMPDRAVVLRVQQLVRQVHGLIGAEALSRAVPEVSRRQAARIKAATLTAMEIERRARVEKVVVSEVGVLRGFDAMHVATTRGRRYLLCAGDGCVPYRTRIEATEHYDERAVLGAIERDLREHGAPLVWRMDRASVHRTDAVRELLDAHGVLLLHGPPHHPGFYGQLERQNREHRAWLDATGELDPELLAEQVQAMRRALNDLWPRRRLGWMTPAEKWATRRIPCDDRAQLRASVAERAAQLRRDKTCGDGDDPLRLERIAIELTLKQRGYLNTQLGGWC